MDNTDITVKMVFDRWHSLVKSCSALLDSISDEDLQKEIVPGRNRGIYLLGHLIAVHDEMMLLLNFGDKLYPALSGPFLQLPDKSVSDIPAAKELREMWSKQQIILNEHFASLQPGRWFEKHNAVSAEDFIKEPHRNKLNIIITRSTHLAYHTGQLQLLK